MPPCPRNSTITCAYSGYTPDGLCCKVIPTDRPCEFSVVYRNPGHWDIITKCGRAFRIRGKPDKVLVADERVYMDKPMAHTWKTFKTVSKALAWCASELMDVKENKDDSLKIP